MNEPQFNAPPPSHIEGKKRLLLREANSWIGKAREQGGNNRGQIVEMFQRSVSEWVVGLAWCLAFIWYCIKEAQTQADAYAGCTSLPCQLPVTAGCMDLWARTDRAMRIELPEPGAIMLLQLYENGMPTIHGHACVVEARVGEHDVRTIDGNASGADSPQAQREGDTVRKKTRRWRLAPGESWPGTGLRPVGFLRVWTE